MYVLYNWPTQKEWRELIGNWLKYGCFSENSDLVVLGVCKPVTAIAGIARDHQCIDLRESDISYYPLPSWRPFTNRRLTNSLTSSLIQSLTSRAQMATPVREYYPVDTASLSHHGGADRSHWMERWWWKQPEGLSIIDGTVIHVTDLFPSSLVDTRKTKQSMDIQERGKRSLPRSQQ